MAHAASTFDREISSLVSASNHHSLSGYIPQADLAAELKVHTRTLRRWEAERVGPLRTKIGKKIYYSRAAIEHWLLDRTSRPCRRRRAA
jgi:hypothetical protein